jgi:hypothetical protein
MQQASEFSFQTTVNYIATSLKTGKLNNLKSKQERLEYFILIELKFTTNLMHTFFYSIILLYHDPLHISSVTCSSSGGHCIFTVSGILTLCMLPYVALIKSGLSPLLIGATYGSIQSVIPDTANIQLS